ncbi:VTT domain-containing protein [Actinomadura viridis]|uniref:Membrane protein DedA with SNARE-associated domain n=1 Tax=Actinomadura viridis TaxID=58110 RepID=A0A931DEP4_9ACTN|nr:DedA family protein [Actinomadura viridis]MBG6089714.1 membrane protein DedA with SNARE-associated domain [Actinomadura viridis]
MDVLADVLHAAVTSPWFYVALLVVAVVDGFFPVVPSESMLITGGVYAATGEPELWLVIVVAAVGAFVGDHVSYLLGRGSGGRLVGRLRPGSRWLGGLVWARGVLAERGGLILVVARYLPGGRTAVTFTMGAVGYRLRSFSLFALVAAVTWALYGGLLGFVGGSAFEDDPVKGVVMGIGLAVSLTVVVEVARWVVRRRRRGRAGACGEGAGEGAGDAGGAVENGVVTVRMSQR